MSIKFGDLKQGFLYKIAARNASYGIWVERRGAFLISRTKFDDNYLFEEWFRDKDEINQFGTAIPIKEIEKSPFEPEDMEIVTKQNESGVYYSGYRKGVEILDYLNSKSKEEK